MQYSPMNVRQHADASSPAPECPVSPGGRGQDGPECHVSPCGCGPDRPRGTLRWLARTQAVDGSWDGDAERTAAALLAFLRARAHHPHRLLPPGRPPGLRVADVLAARGVWRLSWAPRPSPSWPGRPARLPTRPAPGGCGRAPPPVTPVEKAVRGWLEAGQAPAEDARLASQPGRPSAGRGRRLGPRCPRSPAGWPASRPGEDAGPAVKPTK